MIDLPKFVEVPLRASSHGALGRNRLTLNPSYVARIWPNFADGVSYASIVLHDGLALEVDWSYEYTVQQLSR